LESRRWQTVEIARWFGIPPHLLGDVEKSTSWGTGIEQQNIGFVAYTLRPWLNRIEQRVTREVVEPATQYAEFLIDGLLRGDTAERYAAYSTGIQWGFITRNEARVKENLVPLDGLDEPLTPLNMSKGDEETPLAPGSTSAPTPSPDPAVA
jgi:HK97 family phage portal protein